MFKGTVKEKWADLKHSSRFFGLVLALLGAIRLMTVLACFQVLEKARRMVVEPGSARDETERTHPSRNPLLMIDQCCHPKKQVALIPR